MNRSIGGSGMRVALASAAFILAFAAGARGDDVTLNSNTNLNNGGDLNSTPVVSEAGGSGTAAVPWLYDFAPNSGVFDMGGYQLVTTDGDSFELNLNGMAIAGDSGTTTFLTGGPAASLTDGKRGSVTIVNAGNIAIGAIDARVTGGFVGTRSGMITLGTAEDGAVGSIRADWLNTTASGGYTDGQGTISIYSSGDVLIRTAGGVAGDVDTRYMHDWGGGVAGPITIVHDGSFMAKDILSSGTITGSGRNVTVRGNADGGAPGGSFQARMIDASTPRSGADDISSGSITISGYTNVHVTGSLLTHQPNNTYRGTAIVGDITITNATSIHIDGTIDASLHTDTTRASVARWGALTVQATGTIQLASLDLHKVKSATLSATNGTTITGDLLNFPTNTPASGLLDAATNTVIYFTWNLPNNMYLQNRNYTLKSGGQLIAQASDIPVMANRPVSDVTANSASLNGSLVATGKTDVTVSVYWGPANGSTNANDWANTNTFARGQWGGGDSPATNIATLAANTNYYYHYYGLADGGGAWASNDVVSFITGELSVQATDPTGRASANDPGVFTVYRPAGCTNENLVVNYVLGGTATPTTDYLISPASGSVILGRGQTEGAITITPVYNKYDVEKTVILTLTNGPYVLAAPAPEATVTLAAVTPVTSDVTLTNTTTLANRAPMLSTPAIAADPSVGAGTAANPWLYSFVPYTKGTFIMGDHQLKTVNGDSFRLDLNGMDVTGSSGRTNLSTATGTGVLTDQRSGSITLVNAGDIDVGGITTYLSFSGYVGAGAGSIKLGESTASIGNLRADFVYSGCDASYCSGAGSISIYSRGNVFIRTAAGTPGDLSARSLSPPAGSISVSHQGSFAANDILSYSPANSGGEVTIDGAVGSAPTGSFQARTIDTSSLDTWLHHESGPITISGYTTVHVTGNLLTYQPFNTWVSTLTGGITITNVGDVRVDGVIDTSFGQDTTRAYLSRWGALTIQATGTIQLADLNLHKVKSATLSAANGTTIAGELLNFPTNTPADGLLDAPANRVIYYDPNHASNAYLVAGTYTLMSGGLLTTASSPGTFIMIR